MRGLVKTIEKPHRDLNYWPPPNRVGRLIGGRLKGVQLYMLCEYKLGTGFIFWANIYTLL